MADTTTDSTQNEDPESSRDFAAQAEAPEKGLVAEFVTFLGENKRWWLIPIIITLLLLGFLLFLGSGPLAPFVYTLF